MKESQKKPKPRPKNFSKKNLPLDKSPVDDSQISVREFKPKHTYDVHRIVNDFRRDYYITVFKGAFQNLFTYAITSALLAISLTYLRSNAIVISFPPILITFFILWKVNQYKRKNQLFTIGDMERWMQNESFGKSFKSSESRRVKQGIYLVFIKRSFSEDMSELLDTDLETESDSADSDSKDIYLSKKLVGYLIYSKHEDELQTVSIKEICIDKDYRNRKIATCFLRRVCKKVFKNYGYRRVSFQVSNFHKDATKICNKHLEIFKKIFTWKAFYFLPGVVDERTEFTFYTDKI